MYKPVTLQIHSFEEFSQAIGDYYQFHVTRCLTEGGCFSNQEAMGRAKQLIEDHFRRRGVPGGIQAAFKQSLYGTNGGLRNILNMIAQGILEESIERYIRDVLDQYINPSAWEEKVAVMRDLLAHTGSPLLPDIHPTQPERYAPFVDQLIRSYINAMRDFDYLFRGFAH